MALALGSIQTYSMGLDELGSETCVRVEGTNGKFYDVPLDSRNASFQIVKADHDARVTKLVTFDFTSVA